MRIVVVTTSYPRSSADHAGRFVQDLNAGLLALGHETLTLAPGTGSAVTSEGADGGPVMRVDGGPAARDLAYGDGMEENARRIGPVGTLLGLRAMGRAYRDALAQVARRGDVVLAHWLFPSAWWSATIAAARGARMAAVAHGGDASSVAHPIAGRLVARAARAGSCAVLAVSAGVRDAVAARLRVPASTLPVVPMGVDTRTFHAGEAPVARAPLIAAVGRLLPIKGFDVLVEACRGLPHDLVIGGAGPLRESLERLAASSGVRLTLPGALDPHAVADLFRRAAVVVVPSRRLSSGRVEGTPVVAIEALACGAAVVGTAAGGTAELLAPHALAAPGDAASLRRTILAALADPGSFRQPDAAARFDRVAVASTVLSHIVR